MLSSLARFTQRLKGNWVGVPFGVQQGGWARTFSDGTGQSYAQKLFFIGDFLCRIFSNTGRLSASVWRRLNFAAGCHGHRGIRDPVSAVSRFAPLGGSVGIEPGIIPVPFETGCRLPILRLLLPRLKAQHIHRHQLLPHWVYSQEGLFQGDHSQ